jgi:hypothetical protein
MALADLAHSRGHRGIAPGGDVREQVVLDLEPEVAAQHMSVATIRSDMVSEDRAT